MNDIIDLVNQLSKHNISIPNITIDDINLERIDLWLADSYNINIIIWSETDEELNINNWVYEVFDISEPANYISLNFSTHPINSKREAKKLAIKAALKYLINQV